MVQIANPLTIVNTGGQDEPGGDSHITAYDTATGVITGDGFGSTIGVVYLLDRDTNTYVPQAVSSWYNTSITLANPIDTSVIEGTTSLVVVNGDGIWSTKWVITGGVAVTGWAKLYIQNPDTRAIYTVSVDNSTDFNKLYNSTSNGFAKQIAIGSDTFYSDEIVGVQFGSSFGLMSISNSFLRYATNLNQPVVFPAGVTAIEQYLLAACYGFNQPVVFQSGLTVTGDYLLFGSYNFNQPITFPSTTTDVGSYFLRTCYAFNQRVSAPGLTRVKNNFLESCKSFNQPLTIPSGVTSIGGSFLASCSSFDQPLTIPSGVTSIGTQFLQNCFSFNQPLTIPSGVTGSIGGQFMFGCTAFSNLTVDTTVSPTDTNSLSVSYNTAKMYVKGVTVKGTGRSSWISALPNRTSTPFRKLIDGGE